MNRMVFSPQSSGGFAAFSHPVHPAILLFFLYHVPAGSYRLSGILFFDALALLILASISTEEDDFYSLLDYITIIKRKTKIHRMYRGCFSFYIVFQGLVLLAQQQVQANPVSPTVHAGGARFASPCAEVLEIIAQDRSIISWKEFSIAPSEITRFVLPDAKAIVLNRVDSSLPSQLDGVLSSNGVVYLINPNGILITPNGQINTAGFLASTLDVDDRDFLKGGDLLFSGNSLASVVNQGNILSWDGDAILIAHRVQNQQHIEAPRGVVALGAGKQLLLTPQGNQRLSVLLQVDAGEGVGVDQAGTIEALQAELKADGNLYGYAIKNEGAISAIGFQEREGRIYLVAEGGLTTSSGLLQAQGGEVHLLGKYVTLTDHAVVDVSGKSGGGTLLVGGDFQGKNPAILNAQQVFVGEEVQVHADALDEGQGGKAIFWAEDATAFYGTVSVRGGEKGPGDGGLVEVSGIHFLDFQGRVDARAPQGKTGTLLLDPTSVTISTAGDAGMTISACVPPITYTPTGAPATANVNIATLLANLATCSVTITSASGGAGTGDITFSAGSPFTWTGVTTNTLTLIPNGGLRDVVVSATITNSTSGGNIVFSPTRNITFGAGVGLTLSTGGTTTLSASTAITFSTTSPISTGAGTTGGISMSSTGAGTAVSLSCQITHNSTGTLSVAATAGNIVTALGGTGFTFGAGAGPVSFNTTPTGGTITLGAPMTFTAGAGTGTLSATAQTGLTVSAAGTIAYAYPGAYTLSTAAATGNITLGGTFTWTGTNANTGTISAFQDILVNATFTNNSTAGVVSWTANRNITFGAGAGFSMSTAGNATLTANATTTGSISFTATSPLSTAGSGNFSMQSTNAAASTALTLSGTITHASTGTFQTTVTAGNMTAANTMNFSGGPFTLTTSAANGTMTFNSGAALNNNSTSGPSTVNSFGNITFNAGSSFSSSADLNINSNTGTNGTFTTNATAPFTSSGTAVVAFTGKNTAGSNAFSLAGTLTLGSTGAFSIEATTGNTSISGAISHTTDGIFTVTGDAGNITLSGATISFTQGSPVTLKTTPAGGSITLSSSSMTFSPGANAGSLTVNAQTSLAINGTLNYNYTGLCSFTTVTGNITSNASGTMNFNSGSGDVTFQATSSNITLSATPTITFSAGAGNVLFQTDPGSGGTTAISPMVFDSGVGKAMTVSSDGAVTLRSLTYGSTGTCNVTATTGALTAAALTFNFGSLNLTASAANIAATGAITFAATAGALTMSAGTNVVFSGASASVYNSPNPFNITATNGNITTNGTTSLTFNSGSGSLTMTTLGIATGNITNNGTITFNAGAGSLTFNANNNITVGNTIVFDATNPLNMTATLGNITVNGTMSLNTTGTLSMTASAGNITVNNTVRNTLAFPGGAISASCPAGSLSVGTGAMVTPAQIGSAGGDVTITAGVDVLVLGGAALNAIAQIGFDTGDITSNLIFSDIGSNLVLVGGSSNNCYAVIGHGSQVGAGAGGVRTGDITFGSALSPIGADILLQGQVALPSSLLGVNSFAQIGHIRALSAPALTASGDIDLHFVTGSISLIGGNRNDTYALIGHGGGSSGQSDSYTGTVEVGDVTMTGPIMVTTGSALEAFAAIGHTAFLNAPGTVTISSGLIDVGTSEALSMEASVNAEGIVGSYIKATAVGATGTINVTDIQVTTGEDLHLFGAVPSTAFNGLLVGALSYTGTLPLTAAGSAGSNLTVTVGNDLQMQTGSGGGNANVFTLIQNGIGAPVGGPFTLTLSASDTLQEGGNNLSAVVSIGPLTYTASNTVALTASSDPTSSGDALISGQGTTTVSGTAFSLTGTLSGPQASIRNTTQDLSVTATTSLVMLDNANIDLQGGTGTLSVTVGTGGILLGADTLIENLGTGSSTVSTTGNMLFSSNSLGAAAASFNGDATLTAVQLQMLGTVANTASIASSQGTLSLICDTLALNPNANVQLTGGSDPLSVSVADDLLVMSNSSIDNLGSGNTLFTVGEVLTLISGAGSGSITNNTGSLSMTIAGNLNLMTNAGGSAFITSNGPVDISAENITLGGTAAGQQSLIQTSAGDLTIIANNHFSLHDNALIQNTGGGDVSLVSDQQAPLPPLVGPGRFILEPDAQVVTNGGALRIFTARPNGITAGNLAFGQANGNFVTATLSCPFDAPPASATDQYNTYFSTFAGGFGVPYTLFYKTSGSPGPGPAPFIPTQAQLLNNLFKTEFASSELFFILREFLRYTSDQIFLVCDKIPLHRAPHATHSELLSDAKYPVIHQAWTRYPIEFFPYNSCHSLPDSGE